MPVQETPITPPPAPLEPFPPPFQLTPEEFRRVVWTFASRAGRMPNGLRKGELTNDEPRPGKRHSDFSSPLHMHTARQTTSTLPQKPIPATDQSISRCPRDSWAEFSSRSSSPPMARSSPDIPASWMRIRPPRKRCADSMSSWTSEKWATKPRCCWQLRTRPPARLKSLPQFTSLMELADRRRANSNAHNLFCGFQKTTPSSKPNVSIKDGSQLETSALYESPTTRPKRGRAFDTTLSGPFSCVGGGGGKSNVQTANRGRPVALDQPVVHEAISPGQAHTRRRKYSSKPGSFSAKPLKMPLSHAVRCVAIAGSERRSHIRAKAAHTVCPALIYLP